MWTWKKVVVCGLSAGVGFAAAVALTIGGYVWYESRPKPWNTKAISAQFDKADSADDTLKFSYVLVNNTARDYELSEYSDVRVLAKLERQDSLMPGTNYLKPELPVFVPARQRVSFHLRLEGYGYTGPELSSDASAEQRDEWNSTFHTWLNTKMGNLDGFVLFDQANRYRIEFPKGW